MGSRSVGGWYHELLQVWDVCVCGRESLLGLLGSCRMKITWTNWVFWELEKSAGATGCCICSVWLLENLEVVRGSVSFASHVMLLPPSQRLLLLHTAPPQLGFTRETWLLKKTAVRKQFCSPADELRCTAGRVCHLCITAVIDHCCQFLCCKKQRDWESYWHSFLSTVIGGCFCCCTEANAQGARSQFFGPVPGFL